MQEQIKEDRLKPVPPAREKRGLVIAGDGRARFALRGRKGCADLLIFVLELVETIVDSAQSEQLLMGALLAQLSFVENEDAVGVLNGAEAVRDDQRRAPF